jgi:hypothetical protein
MLRRTCCVTRVCCDHIVRRAGERGVPLELRRQLLSGVRYKTGSSSY